MKIGLDIMGGDFAPDPNIDGAILAQKEFSEDVRLVLFGDEEKIKKELADRSVDAGLFDITNAPDVVDMGDPPTKAISQKPNSSIALGFHALRKGDIDGYASTGNTGAMLVGSIRYINTVAGIYRPCITTALPNVGGGFTIVLDVGINADCKPDVLYQFAILGSLFAEYVHDITNPKVGLLNIGAEEKKGNLLTQATFEMMNGTKDFNFVGNVEGRDLLSENIDVIVCDGFTGNVVLKEAEAFYFAFKKRGIEDDYLERFNYENYGGSPILGINAPVIIGHGSSNEVAVMNMIKLTRDMVEADLARRIKIAVAR
jgi:glycerol-3-phosphate acyltransferase PlsX